MNRRLFAKLLAALPVVPGLGWKLRAEPPVWPDDYMVWGIAVSADKQWALLEGSRLTSRARFIGFSNVMPHLSERPGDPAVFTAKVYVLRDEWAARQADPMCAVTTCKGDVA